MAYPLIRPTPYEGLTSPSVVEFHRLPASQTNTPQPMELDEYRKLAEVEDRMWYFSALHRRLGHWLEKLLPPGPATILDAGCGTGGLLRSLSRRNPSWTLTGIDLATVACSLARERTRATIVQGSVTQLPFADNTFDAVVAGDLLSQVEEDALSTREMARCVRPGGVVIANVPAYVWLWSYHDTAVHTKHRYTRGTLRRLFTDAGLQPQFLSYANFLLFPLVVTRRKLMPKGSATSDVTLSSRPMESALRAIAATEFAWMKRGVPSPWGSSVFIAARKPAVGGRHSPNDQRPAT